MPIHDDYIEIYKLTSQTKCKAENDHTVSKITINIPARFILFCLNGHKLCLLFSHS